MIDSPPGEMVSNKTTDDERNAMTKCKLQFLNENTPRDLGVVDYLLQLFVNGQRLEFAHLDLLAHYSGIYSESVTGMLRDKGLVPGKQVQWLNLIGGQDRTTYRFQDCTGLPNRPGWDFRLTNSGPFACELSLNEKQVWKKGIEVGFDFGVSTAGHHRPFTFDNQKERDEIELYSHPEAVNQTLGAGQCEHGFRAQLPDSNTWQYLFDYKKNGNLARDVVRYVKERTRDSMLKPMMSIVEGLHQGGAGALEVMFLEPKDASTEDQRKTTEADKTVLTRFNIQYGSRQDAGDAQHVPNLEFLSFVEAQGVFRALRLAPLDAFLGGGIGLAALPWRDQLAELLLHETRTNNYEMYPREIVTVSLRKGGQPPQAGD